ncbi:DODA-type extradiol aromatic ring-opening family dioxygenase [Micromonospora radicis]|uniref:3-carboxyethylcatechol 2,3-dioxygenase n=1 Tax=Micromonospora radicis TaxID=1894971 RepID=A0A418MWG8_9ACTN|nr:3-carboxyethylcatechol 2,3-dioxygenase [Micromonospora radicis]RIV39225.1 3-carboxyethylcatechol 2,3-dioxygenase [Micromonospora radicis]
MLQRMVVCAAHSPLIDSADAGTAGRDFLQAVAEAKDRIATFDPELVVFFGPDHSRAFTNLVPAVTVVTSAHGYGDWGTSTAAYAVDTQVAEELGAALVDRTFDVALGADIALDHGFGQTFQQLFGTLGALPSLPIVLNCARPPRQRVDRAIELGRAVGQVIAGTGRRVLYVASGGLSHQPPSMRAHVTTLPEAQREAVARRSIAQAAEHIDADWDDRFLRHLCTSDWAALRRIDDVELDAVGSGTHEIRTWVAAWAAAAPSQGDFTYRPVPEWITGMGVAVGAG